MSGPQKENGYTPIANEIMEAVAKLKINATQFRILIVVWRYTYGFSRKEHYLSESFISKATGIHKKQIGRELALLIERNILIEVKPPSFSSTRVLKFNKHYKRWQSTKTLTGSETVAQTGSELVDSPGSELVDQDKQNLKQKTKESVSAENILNYWNSKKLFITHELRTEMLKQIEKGIKKYSEEKVIEAIDNYGEVLSSNFYYSHKWRLDDFIRQKNGVPDFLEEGKIWENYKEHKSNNSIVDGRKPV